MIMKSNYQSTPCDNTVNTVQYWLSNWALQLTRFLYFTTNLQRKQNRTNLFSKPNRNQNRMNPRFSQNRTELKNSFRTSLVFSIPREIIKQISRLAQNEQWPTCNSTPRESTTTSRTSKFFIVFFISRSNSAVTSVTKRLLQNVPEPCHKLVLVNRLNSWTRNGC